MGEETEAAEAEEAELEFEKDASGTALERCIPFEPKLRTKTNQPPVRGGVELQMRSRRVMWEEGVARSNTTEARLIDRTTFHRVSHGKKIRTRRTRHHEGIGTEYCY